MWVGISWSLCSWLELLLSSSLHLFEPSCSVFFLADAGGHVHFIRSCCGDHPLLRDNLWACLLFQNFFLRSVFSCLPSPAPPRTNAHTDSSSSSCFALWGQTRIFLFSSLLHPPAPLFPISCETLCLYLAGTPASPSPPPRAPALLSWKKGEKAGVRMGHLDRSRWRGARPGTDLTNAKVSSSTWFLIEEKGNTLYHLNYDINWQLRSRSH